MDTKVINALTFDATYVLTTLYAICETAASNQTKQAKTTPGSAFSLEKGVRVAVKFIEATTTQLPLTLSINESDNKKIYFKGQPLTSSQYWAAGSVIDFVYDGDYWQMLGSLQNLTNVAFINAENTFTGTQTITIANNQETDVALEVTKGQIKASTFNATSDARLKENFRELTSEKSILNLPTYKFDFINGAKDQIGCKAQDLQEICPEIVNEGSDGYLSIQESKIVYLLLDEIKKLRAEVDELKRRD